MRRPAQGSTIGSPDVEPEALNLQRIASDSELATVSLSAGCLRPLAHRDEPELSRFLTDLSDRTRRFYSVVDPQMDALERCEAIGRYDKLRLILEGEQAAIIGLVEYSFDLVPDDLNRCEAHGVPLDATMDCRFGLCLADRFQSRGMGSTLLPFAIQIARQFGRRRMILWGGVHADNEQAIRFYRKNQFEEVGGFVNQDGRDCVDMMLTIETR